MKFQIRHINQPPRPGPLLGMVPRLPRPNETWGEPYLISQDEAAHRLGVSRTTLWRLMRNRELEPVSIGSRTLVLQQSLTDYIDRHRSSNPSR